MVRLTAAERTTPYRRRWFGWLWVVLMPIIPVSAYLLLRLALPGPVAPGDLAPAAYVGIGVTLWFLYKDLFLAAFVAFRRQGPLLAQTPYPIGLAICTEISSVLIDFVIRAVFVVAVLVMIGLPEGSAPFLGGLMVLAAAASFAAAGIVALPLFILFPDLEDVSDILFRYLIFFSFAIFPIDLGGLAGQLLALNPFGAAIEGTRGLLTSGVNEGTHWGGRLWALSALVLVWGAGLVLQRFGPAIKEAAR